MKETQVDNKTEIWHWNKQRVMSSEQNIRTGCPESVTGEQARTLEMEVRREQPHVVAQAACHRLSTAAAWDRARHKSCGICRGHSGTGTGFLRAFPFPLPLIHSPTAPLSQSVSQGCYNMPINGHSNSGLGSTTAKRKHGSHPFATNHNKCQNRTG
jgi:hypothetical protein